MSYHWEKITDDGGFAPCDGAGALVFRDKMWLLGGWNPDDKTNFPRICHSEVRSSTDGAQWKLENPNAPWEPRHCAGYVLHDGQMWIVGGDSSQGHHQTDVWKSSDGIVWQLATNDAPWSPRGMIGGSVVFGSRMWLLGGGTFETPLRPQRKLYNEVWSSADGLNWHQHPNAPWAARQFHEVAVFDDKIWVLEGYTPDGGNRNDVWFSEDGENWSELSGTPWSERHAASVFVFQNALWIVAGNNMQPDVWRLKNG